MAALPWATGVVSLSLLSALFGGAGALGGFYFSYTNDLPLGPVIVCVSGVLLAGSYGLRSLRGVFK
jgi:ABC-type Mn2+/Zn2+ transport system permease subunit